jgi:hypothetical protein
MLVESLLLFMDNKVIHSSGDQSDKLSKEKLQLRTNKAYPSSSLEHELKGIRLTPPYFLMNYILTENRFKPTHDARVSASTPQRKPVLYGGTNYCVTNYCVTNQRP